MKASIVDLRYKMKDVLEALDKNEDVTILYHGKVKGVIKSVVNSSYGRVTDHSFFSMNADEEISVAEEMEQLRGGRFRAV